MGTTLLSIFIAVTGYSVQNLSQASQKLGFIRMKDNRLLGMLIWGASTIGTGLSTLILLAAVSIGQVSLVGAMAGTGLVSMTIYSRLVFKHNVSRNEIIGVSLILAAAVLIGIFAVDVSNSVIEVKILTIKLILVSFTYGILWVVFLKKRRALCIILGGFAGAIGGFVSQFQKISTSARVGGEIVTGQSPGLSALLNPFTLIWILLSVSSMIVLQFAHKNGRPMRVIPAFSANYILIPVIGGVTCFGEILHPLQWLGIMIIIAGVFMITIRAEKHSDGGG